MKKALLTLLLLPISTLACEVAVLYTKPESCKLVKTLETERLDSEHLAIEELQHKAFSIYANTIYVKDIEATEITVHDFKEPVSTHYSVTVEAYDCRQP